MESGCGLLWPQFDFSAFGVYRIDRKDIGPGWRGGNVQTDWNFYFAAIPKLKL